MLKNVGKRKKEELGLVASTSSNSFATNKEDELVNIVRDSYYFIVYYDFLSFSVDET